MLLEELQEVLESPLQPYKFVPVITTDDDGIEVSNIDFRQMLELPIRMLTASEILWRLETRHVGSFGEYESFLESINWEHYFEANASVKVRVQSFRSAMYHEGKLEKIARLILSNKGHGEKDSKYTVRVEQKENRCSVYLALSADPLFRRGYKIDYTHPAPLQEHLAAAAIRWTCDNERPDLIYVPFAGSGTLVMESWLYEQRPSLDIWRPLKSIESLPEFPMVTWKFFKTKLNIQRETVKARAIEWDKKGIEVLAANLQHAEKSWPSIAGQWETAGTDFLEDKCPAGAKNIFVPLNPPYGLRLDGEDTQDLYLKLGTWLHEAFAPEQRRFGFVLLADSKAFHAFEKGVGSKHVGKILSFTQGGQHIRCVSFDVPAVSNS
ncbi:MAG: hypothetical protein EOP07_25735 [Proteobacteria bacterium]|nr:MAG: hypothetical protein EOP07_25735 [Pseudomonadota bacterium]